MHNMYIYIYDIYSVYVYIYIIYIYHIYHIYIYTYIYIYIQSHGTFSRPAPGPWPGSRSCRLRAEPQVWMDQCLGRRPQAEGIGFSSAMSWKSMEIPYRNGGFIWFYMVLYGFI